MGETQADANIILSLFAPSRYSLPYCRDYDIKKLRDRYRLITCLKNRDGEADIASSMYFLGECGFFQELPRASEMTNEDYERFSK